jgi:drug/metabolite transporter (DMT)-like permease
MDEKSHFFRNTLLVIGGVIVVGWVALWLIHFVFSIMLYIIVGAVIVGGGYYLYGRAKKSLQSGRVSRQLRR